MRVLFESIDVGVKVVALPVVIVETKLFCLNSLFHFAIAGL